MRSHTKWLIIGATVLALAGCGGAGGGGGAGAGAPGAPGGGMQSLSGTAAVGAPLPQAVVTLTDANGRTIIVQADDMGQFTFPDVSTLTAPLMLRATGTAGGRQHVLFSASLTLVPTLNVTPLTTAVVEMVLPGEGTANSVFNSFSVNAQQLADLNAAKTRALEALNAVLTSLQLPPNTNPFTTPFVADGRGLDRLLDLIDFIESEANELLIIDKSDRRNVSTVTFTGPVTPLPAPSAARLDTSGIRTLINDLNALTDPRDKAELIDVDFMHSGESKAVFLAELRGIMLGITNWAIDGCRTLSDVSICNLSLNLRESLGDFQVEHGGVYSIQVIQRNGNWLFYGNQAPFYFEFHPVVLQENEAPLRRGLALNIESPMPNRTLLLSEDGGRNFTIDLGSQLSPENCLDDYFELGSTGGATQCFTWLIPLPQAEAQRLNGLISRGLVYAKIRVSSGMQTYEHVFAVRTPFFTDADSTMKDLSVSGLGTAMVTVSGSNIEGVGVAFSADGVDFQIASWDMFDLHRYPLPNGQITLSAAFEACLRWHDHLACDAALDPAASFTAAMLLARDSLGRFVLVRRTFMP